MNSIKSGIFGQIVGDALGLPVQFRPREDRDKEPVNDMIGHGAFDMPAGSWSDDSSLILATIDGLTKSLKRENIDKDSKDLSLNDIIDYEIIMKNFSSWLNDGQFTPYGFAYDVGGATMKGIYRYDDGCEPIKSGGIGERDNGNGSLMRILPITFFIYFLSEKYSFDLNGLVQIEVDEAGILDQIGNTGDSLTQHIVGDLKCVGQCDLLVCGKLQAIVGDD